MSASSSTKQTLEIKRDRATRVAYSCDASIFEVVPQAVAFPKSKEDVIRCVKLGMPITARGAATGTTGGALGKGLIVDLSRYLNRFHFNGKTVRCDPGVVQDDLNKELNFYGLRLGPDTSSGNRATVGGMFANNAAGARSPKFGTTADHVISCEMVLSDGSLVTFGPLTEEELQAKCALPTLEGAIYHTAAALRDQNLPFPKIPRRVSGYNLAMLQEKPFNLAKVLAGSEGTLGIVTEIEFNVVKMLPQTYLELHFYPTMREAFKAIPKLMEQPFISMELIDEHIIHAAKESFIAKHHLSWIQEGARCVVYVEREGDKEGGPKESVFLLRRKGLELLLSKRGYTRAVGFLEDISYPPEKSLEFYDKFLSLFHKFPEVGIYGHVGAGCIHVRPFLDLRNLEMTDMMRKGTEVLKSLGGSLSGEHGDGLVRSWLNKELYGEEIYNAFIAFKEAFDPKNIFNPGKIISDHFPKELLRSLPKKEIPTFLDFSKEGGLALAADLCNGNGLCRKHESLMCPSFQATNSEFDTTRARAQLLRHADNLSDPDLKEVLDLCLQCKGCKVECPSTVDMAKMKAEVLYHQKRSLRDYGAGHVATLWKLGSYFPALYNALQPKGYPLLSKKQFPSHLSGDVILFNDTYTHFINPNIGYAAQSLLKNAYVPPWMCCGRPLYSKGFLKEAKQQMERVVEHLLPLNKEIVVLEPSCYSMLKEDIFGLLGYQNKRAQAFAERVSLIDVYLKGKLPPLPEAHDSVLIHTHCHQKASEYAKSTYELLQSLSPGKVQEAKTGCCGMAGSFGYDHPDLSKKILNLSLKPAIMETDYTALIANGFSCRSQVEKYIPEHVVQFLARSYSYS